MKQIAGMFVLAVGFLLAAQPAAADSGRLYLKLPGVVGPVTVVGQVPQLSQLMSAGASMTIADWRAPIKQVTVTITWRSGDRGGMSRSKTLVALVSPKGVTP